jgi:peptidoglycan/xylan/chitin deacetylase (PgdA/CDA1 family)
VTGDHGGGGVDPVPRGRITRGRYGSFSAPRPGLARRNAALLALGLAAACGPTPRPPEKAPAPGEASPGDPGAEADGGYALAVTVDDLPFTGPTAPGDDPLRATGRILGHLADDGAPATGFVNCDRVDEAGTAVIAAWRDAGHGLGNHTADHAAVDDALGAQDGEARERDEAARGANDDAPLDAWGASVARCRNRLAALTGASPRWFRYPYLRRGATAAVRYRAAAAVAVAGHRVAPVTIDTADWALVAPYAEALRAGDDGRAREIGEAYVTHVVAAARHYRARARRDHGREVAQVLLLHANALAADHLGAVLSALAEDGARFVSLDEALRDRVYTRREVYVGEIGLSWLYRIAPGAAEAWRWDRAQLAALRIRFGGRAPATDAWVDADLRWRALAPGTWAVTHVGPFDSHSLVAEMPDGTLLLADTPPTTDATERLLGFLRARFGPRPLVAIDGHSHTDSSGGNAAVLAAGGSVYGAEDTAARIRAEGPAVPELLVDTAAGTPLADRYRETRRVPPDHTFPAAQGLVLRFGGEAVRVFHPGHAHAPDNVVTWLPARRVLFGGCMVIGMERIGYTGDADMAAWPDAIRRLQALDPAFVVPGHGARFGPEALVHTLRLLEEAAGGP